MSDSTDGVTNSLENELGVGVEVAKAILADPILLRQVGDRVFELLQEDVRNQRDRAGYSRRFSR